VRRATRQISIKRNHAKKLLKKRSWLCRDVLKKSSRSGTKNKRLAKTHDERLQPRKEREEDVQRHLLYK